MKFWPHQLLGSFSNHETVSLRIRIFRLFCTTTCFLCLVVVLPINLFQNLPVWVNIADTGIGLVAGYCYWASQRGRDHFHGFFWAILVALNPIWFLNAGADGSLTYYFFPLVLYPVAVFEGAMRRWLVAAVVVNACGLLVFEYCFPSLTVPFHSRTDRVLDLTTGVLCSCLAIVVVLLRVISGRSPL